MIGIVTAMEAERDAILARFASYETVNCAGRVFYVASLEGQDVVVALSGVGKVNAAYTAALLIRQFAPAAVLSVGVSGGLGQKKQLDVVIADKTCQYDFDLTAVGGELGKVFYADENLLARLAKSLPSASIGTVATGDMFVASRELSQRLAVDFGACACDMEAASIAQCAQIAGVPFGCIRAISDNADDNAPLDFTQFTEVASQIFADAVCKFLQDS